VRQETSASQVMKLSEKGQVWKTTRRDGCRHVSLRDPQMQLLNN
jgi:hypothetical protein